MGAIFNFLFSPYGRVSRQDIWVKFLIPYIGISILALGADLALFGFALVEESGFNGVFGSLTSLFFFWPSIAVPVKRFHDRGMTGWWVLILPAIAIVFLLVVIFGFQGITGGDTAASDLIVGSAVLIAIIPLIYGFVVNYCLAGHKGPNKFGEDPLGTASDFAETFG
ncbi:MAG: DUF805 domain-containing protein [Pseudomonadota bacterium]